ncbi:MAG: helix-turn-helix domain-containing protein [Muribaculaceae bacterium]|nr:helix-turn-helix domain-containing protein [Muribaculaceae bacterium]
MGIIYDDINLPEKVSDILLHDFFLMENVPAMMVKTVKNPVKFSAFTSIFVTRGSCEADINLSRYSIEAPAIINVMADQIVMPRHVPDDFQASFMVFSDRLVNSISACIKDLGIYQAAGSRPVQKIDIADLDAYNRFYADMRAISHSKNAHTYEALLFTTAAFFHTTVIKYFESMVVHDLEGMQNRIADKFMRLVQQNFRKERFLNFYADKLEITPKHLSRTVKTQTGISAVEWITRFIILEAKVMLRSSNLNIQQISDELNFPSQSFFGKYFKKATGVTPKEYRASNPG